ncbi:MAG: CHASE domain-containing protein, partial [Bacteroidales bacterium]
MKNRYPWKTWLNLIISLFITLIATIYVKSEIDIKNEAEFTFECKEIADKIETRLHTHALLLRSVAALFDASDSVSREDWKNFIKQYNVDNRLPGILGVGFTLKIPKDSLIDHISKIRNEGFPEYEVWPKSDREIYTSIIYLEPFSGRNLLAFGYDMMSDSVRREAMERARDMNMASISGKVFLAQENRADIQAAHLMYVPVYHKGAELKTIEQRRAAILGWVYSPYLMNNLISSILHKWEFEKKSHRYSLHIYDGAHSSSESLLFKSHNNGDYKKNRFTFDFSINFNGHQWTLLFTQGKGNFLIDYLSAWGVFVGGLIISFSLFLLSQSLIKTKDREHLEEIVTERTQELIVSKQKLLQSIKDISDYKKALDESSSVAITDNKGVIKYANDKFCKMSKFTRDELVGNTHRIVNSGFHSKEFFTDLWSTISKGNVWRGEIRNRAKDGSYYWLDSTIIPFLDQNDKPYQYVGVRFNITRRKLIEADLIKAKEAADSANRAKSNFLAHMSHEIRTPMNAVIGFSELLSKSIQDKKQHSQIESIHSSAKNLVKIINDILDLSKIEAGKIDLRPVPTKIYDLLIDIQKIFTHNAKEKGIQIILETRKKCNKTLLLDEVRFRQIMFNLIGNAVKFTDKGYVSLIIDTTENSDNKENIDLTIQVKDTGIGIPANLQEDIFNPFYQQPDQNLVKYGGTGLGLPITRKLVKKMGGTISYKSKVGKGSTFIISLPNIPVLENTIDITKKADDTPTVLFKPATVLIADDNEENRKLIIDLLDNSPLTIIETLNGEQAVKMAKKHIPALILMDLQMPVMDGYE